MIAQKLSVDSDSQQVLALPSLGLYVSSNAFLEDQTPKVEWAIRYKSVYLRISDLVPDLFFKHT